MIARPPSTIPASTSAATADLPPRADHPDHAERREHPESSESRDTREKILDAAASLFAAADSRGASLRAIARRAGVNPALVHYHFGSREALLESIILRAISPIQARRQALIRALRSRSASLAPHDLARLFVEPLLADPSHPTDRETTDLRLLTRVFTDDRSLAQELTLEHFGDVMRELGALLGEALPGIPVATRQRRMRFCVQAALETLSGHETRASAEGGPAARTSVVADLLDFIAGGLSAPAPAAAPGLSRSNPQAARPSAGDLARPTSDPISP